MQQRSLALVLTAMRDAARDKRSITPSLLNRLWEHEKLSYALRIFIALLGSAVVCWYLNDIVALATVFLGLIASAVAETDDNWVGRTKAVILQMVCFTLASAGVVLLFPYPLAFLFGLMVATFSVIQLGALGPRYVMIAQATLTLSTYAMVTVDRTTGMAEAWKSIIPLLGGAAWYGVLSIIWFGLLANRPVRDRLSNLFNALNRLLQAKADLIEPVREADQHALRLKVAKCNGDVVEALNSAKAAITSRFGRSGRPGVESGFYFRLYFLAQDVQERASSTHYVQSDVTDAYFHSDVLYRVGRLTRLQGDACASLAQAIRKLTPFEPSARVRSARAELEASIDYLRSSGTVQQKRMLGTLQLAVQNLGKVERQMSEAVAPDSTLDNVDTRMRDSSPRTLQEMWARIRQQFTPKSTFFRHGVRMAVALAAGYMLQPLLPLLNINNGYWLMMTTVFVSRNSYATTRLRMFQRIFGTFFGVAAAWAILQLVPSIEAQMFLASASALIFLTTRATNYMLASAAVSVMALLCFNQMGDGYVALAPRLLDTVIGAVIAFLAASLILPDWQGKRLHAVAASVLKNSSRYLEEVLAHYREDGRDVLAYRAARRDMHGADAALSAVMAGVLREPAKYRGNVDAGFRFLALSNTLLSYLSALGSHRGALDRNPDGELVAAAGQQLQQALNQIAEALVERKVPLAGDAQLEESLAAQLDAGGEETPESHVGVDHTAGERRLIRSQLALMLRMLPSIRSTASTLVQDK